MALVKVRIQQREVNNFGNFQWYVIETYTANYQPGMHTTAFSVVHVSTDFFKDKEEDFSVFSRAVLI